MKKKACKKCKLIVSGDECEICKGTQFATNWKGRIIFLSAGKSAIAKRTGVSVDGEYAIKVT